MRKSDAAEAAIELTKAAIENSQAQDPLWNAGKVVEFLDTVYAKLVDMGEEPSSGELRVV